MAAAILITGANRGLGFEFARQYLTEGWRVIAACRNPAAASNLRRLEQNAEGMLKIAAMDVAVDVLINSAGIAGVLGQKTGLTSRGRNSAAEYQRAKEAGMDFIPALVSGLENGETGQVRLIFEERFRGRS